MLRLFSAFVLVCLICIYGVAAEIVTIEKGNCRRGGLWDCKMRCTVTLDNGTTITPNASDMYAFKQEQDFMGTRTLNTSLPTGHVNKEGVYVFMATESRGDPSGNYFCGYTVPDTTEDFTSLNPIVLALSDSITVTADKPNQSCTEKDKRCRVRCSITGINFRRWNKRRDSSLIKFYKLNTTTDEYDLVTSGKGRIRRGLISLNWKKFNAVNVGGTYKCAYGSVESEAVTLDVYPVCERPTIRGGFIMKPRRRYTKDSGAFTVQCYPHNEMTGSATMTCTGAVNTVATLGPAPTCTQPARSVTETSSTVTCTEDNSCEISCDIRGIVGTPKRRKMAFYNENVSSWDRMPRKRASLSATRMTLTIASVRSFHAGNYMCEYEFANSDKVESGTITLIVNSSGNEM